MSMSQGRQQAAATREAADFNAYWAERQASEALYDADREANNVRENYRRLRASQTAAYAASGVEMQGTPLAVLAEASAQEERDVLSVLLGGSRRATALREQATADQRYQYSVAGSQSSRGFGTLLGSVANVGGSFFRSGGSVAGGALGSTGNVPGLNFPSGSFA